MKKWVSNGLKAAAFSLIAGLSINYIYGVVAWKDTTGGYLSSTSQLYNTGENLCDVVFLGSSHCYCGIYPEYLWEDEGIAAFDMAVSGQDKISTYHALKEVLKTQSPKVVGVDMYGLLFDRHEVKGNEYRNILSLDNSINFFELVNDYVLEEERKDFLLRWPIVHTRYRELGQYDFVQYKPSVFGRGADIQWTTSPAQCWQSCIDNRQVAELSEGNRKWLNDLVELSVEYDFDLIFFVAPCLVDDNQQAIMNAASQFAAEKGIAFFDFNKLNGTLGLDYDTDFVDSNHCNALGAKKVTGYIKKYLTTEYNLEDHRGDDRYYQWEQSLKWFHMLEDINYLETAGPGRFGKKASKMEEVSFVISLEGNYLEAETDIYKLLKYFGISREAYEAGGKWIYKEGELSKICDNEKSDEYITDLGKYDTLRVRYIDDYNYQNIMIGDISYTNTISGLKIIMYNDFLEEVAFEREFY